MTTTVEDVIAEAIRDSRAAGKNIKAAAIEAAEAFFDGMRAYDVWGPDIAPDDKGVGGEKTTSLSHQILKE